MQVYSLLGFIDYEGQNLLGVFGSESDMERFILSKREEMEMKGRRHRLEFLGYDNLGYVVSELGSKIDVDREVNYME